MKKLIGVVLVGMILLMQGVVFADMISPAAEIGPGVIAIALIAMLIILVAAISIIILKKKSKGQMQTEETEKAIEKRKKMMINAMLFAIIVLSLLLFYVDLEIMGIITILIAIIARAFQSKNWKVCAIILGILLIALWIISYIVSFS